MSLREAKDMGRLEDKIEGLGNNEGQNNGIVLRIPGESGAVHSIEFLIVAGLIVIIVHIK